VNFNGSGINKIMFNGAEITETNMNGMNMFSSYIKEIIAPSITRSSKTISPLQNLNVASNNIPILYDIDDAAKHGDMIYIGGQDTETYEYDFSTKIAGSVATCPMKIYRCTMSTLQPPTNITSNYSTGFAEVTDQSRIDKFKYQDGYVDTLMWENKSGSIFQILIELDLTPLCNLKYGGSNAALKADYISIITDIWAMGSGSNAGVQTYGADFYAFYPVDGQWYKWKSNTGSTIIDMAYTAGAGYKAYIDSSNKMYFLLVSTYPSDGTISSSVSLGYAKITFVVKRSADTVNPNQIKLPRYWAMLVKGFSPNWNNANGIPSNIRIFDIGGKLDLRWISSSKFQLTKYGATTTTIQSPAQTFNKNQVYNFLVGQNAQGMFIMLLKNNGTFEKVTNADIQEVSGVYDLKIGSGQLDAYQANAFFESLTFFDLSKYPNGFSSTGAEALLRGQQYAEPNANSYELIVNGDFSQGTTGWYIPSTSSIVNGKLVFTESDSILRQNFQTISVMPNSRYILKAGENSGGRVCCIYYSGFSTGYIGVSEGIFESGDIIIDTPSNCNSVNVVCDNYVNYTNANGTFTFDNISFRQVQYAKVPYLPPKNLCYNGNFSLPTDIGWKLHAVDSIEDGKLVKRATATGQVTHTDFFNANQGDVFKLSLVSKGYKSEGIAPRTCLALYSDITWLAEIAVPFLDGYNEKYITIPEGCTRVQVLLYSIGPGIFTFSNVSLKGPNGVELVRNGDFNIKPNWTLHSEAHIEDGALILNATSAYHTSYIKMPVLPNNRYQMSAILTQSTSGTHEGFMSANEYYNNILLKTSTQVLYASDGIATKTFITGANTNFVTLNASSGVAGTFTFSDISLVRLD
jgi:hypothetical protein